MFLFHIREFLIAVKKYLNIHSNILIENIRSFTVSLYVKYEFTFAVRSPHPANLASTSLQSFILQSHTYYIARKVDRICINIGSTENLHVHTGMIFDRKQLCSHATVRKMIEIVFAFSFRIWFH